MKTLKNKTVLMNLLCALLMFVLLVMQFVPYWHYADENGSCSISGYVWFPTDHDELETWLSDQIAGYDLNGFVGAALLVFITGVLGMAFSLLKMHSGWPAVLTVACGASATLAYLCNDALRLGSGWLLHLLVCAAILAVGVGALLNWLKSTKA